MAKKWSDVAASAAFQSLSLEEQEEARNQYFDGVIAPQVDPSELSVVRDQFLADTAIKPKAAPAPAAEAPKADERGIIQRVKDFISPEYKSVMESYKPTPQEKQANADRRLSYGAGPISSQTEAKADLVRSGIEKSDNATVNKVAAEMDRRKQQSFGDLVQRAKDADPTRFEEQAQSDQRKKFAEETPVLGSVASGAAGMISGAINIPNVAADAFNQTFVNPVLQAAGFNPIPRVANALGTKYLATAASDFMPKVGKQEMGTAIDRSEFTPWLVEAGRQLAPDRAVFDCRLRATLARCDPAGDVWHCRRPELRRGRRLPRGRRQGCGGIRHREATAWRVRQGDRRPQGNVTRQVECHLGHRWPAPCAVWWRRYG